MVRIITLYKKTGQKAGQKNSPYRFPEPYGHSFSPVAFLRHFSDRTVSQIAAAQTGADFLPYFFDFFHFIPSPFSENRVLVAARKFILLSISNKPRQCKYMPRKFKNCL